MKNQRIALCWDITLHRVVVVPYERFGTTCRTLEDGTNRLSRNVGRKLPLFAT